MYREERLLTARAAARAELFALAGALERVLDVVTHAAAGSDLLVSLEAAIFRAWPTGSRRTLVAAAHDVATANGRFDALVAIDPDALDCPQLAEWIPRARHWLDRLPLAQALMPSAAKRLLRRGLRLRAALRDVVMPALAGAAPPDATG